MAAENALVGELVENGWSQRAALAVVGVSRSTWHYRRRPRDRVSDPVGHAARAYPNRLDPTEQARIVGLIRAGAAVGDSVYASWFHALDAGNPVASLASWYRLARRERLQLQVPRRRRRATAMPQFEAHGPNQVERVKFFV